MKQPPAAPVTFREALGVWFRISWQTFGGPAGQIAVMHRELVEQRRWIGERRFLHALSYCTLLPGPEAQQLAIYIGWLMHGIRGGLVAGILFVFPGVAALLGLSAVYVAWGDTPVVTSLFFGLAPAVLVVVAHAVIRLGTRTLTDRRLVVVAIAAFLALAVFAVPFPLVIASAAALGWLWRRNAPFAAPATTADHEAPPLISDDALPQERPSRAYSLRVLGVGLLAWGVPVGLIAVIFGAHSVYVDQGLFFTATSLITFGGAYAVLAYVSQQAVTAFGWVTPTEMVRGLALAESTPGPLIMVVQFVAFIGAYRNPGPLDPWAAGVLGSLVTTWVTFVPCFVFVFLGAPSVERLRGNRALSSALTGITAAVVGVIAHLGLFFALNTLFADTRAVEWGPAHLEVPVLSTLRLSAVAMTVVAAGLLFGLRWSALRTLAACAVIGVIVGLGSLWLS